MQLACFAAFCYTACMHMKTLTQVSLEEIRVAFEQSFSDYELPVRLSIEDLREMMLMRDLSREHSVGCFDEGVLVGFILCGFREHDHSMTLYDGATGVIPSHRGKHLATRMLSYLQELMESWRIDRFLLEVLEHNDSARDLYRKAGFFETRFLRCFRIEKEQLPLLAVDSCCHFMPLSKDEFSRLEHAAFLQFSPSWQNDIPSVLNNWERHAALAVIREGKVAGFGLIHRIKGDMPLIAVGQSECAPRMIDSLVSALARLTESPRLSAINVEEGSLLSERLQSIGWANHVNQFEMMWNSGV